MSNCYHPVCTPLYHTDSSVFTLLIQNHNYAQCQLYLNLNKRALFSFESSLYIEFKMISSGNKIMNYNLTILFELLSTRFSLVVHLFLQVGRRPLFPMFIEPRPNPFSVKIPPNITPQYEKGGKNIYKMWGKKHFKTCASQPILGDFNFQRAFEIP